MAEDGDFFCAMGVHAVMDGPIFNRLQLGMTFFTKYVSISHGFHIHT